MYKRGVWEISFDRGTRILTKIIKLQLLTLFVCLWLNPTQWSQRLKQTRSVSWSFIIFVKILVSWSNEISHTSLLYTKLVLPVETLFLFSCKLCEYKVKDIRENWVSHSQAIAHVRCLPTQHQNDVADVLGPRLVAFYSVSTALIYTTRHANKGVFFFFFWRLNGAAAWSDLVPGIFGQKWTWCWRSVL